jgi:hypothetical protein
MTKPLSEMLPEMEQRWDVKPKGNSTAATDAAYAEVLRLILALKRAHALIEKWRERAVAFTVTPADTALEKAENKELFKARYGGIKSGTEQCADELSRALDEESGEE